MLDINALRSDLSGVAAALAKRGVALDTARFTSLESERKRIQTRTQELQAKRNAVSRDVGLAKRRGDDAEPLLRQVTGLGDELAGLERELDAVQAKLRDFLLDLPNVPDASVPVGRDAEDNVVVRHVGTPRSFEIIAMLVAGGEGTLLGPLFGVALLTLLPTIFQPFKEYLTLAVGAMLVASFLWLPEGLFGTAAIWTARLARRLRRQRKAAS